MCVHAGVTSCAITRLYATAPLVSEATNKKMDGFCKLLSASDDFQAFQSAHSAAIAHPCIPFLYESFVPELKS